MKRSRETTQVQTRSFGFIVSRGWQRRMESADQHNEIEFIFINRGELVFRHGSDEHILSKGSVVLYWAAVPHQVTRAERHTDIVSLTVPLSWVLSWDMTPGLTRRLLQGEMLRISRDVSELPSQIPWLEWAHDFGTGSLELRKVIQLELEAFFRRLALKFHDPQKSLQTSDRRLQNREGYQGVQKMVRYITEHATEPLTIKQIAAEAGLSSEYAMRLFRRHWGMTVWTFLLQQRISHAKRLLVLGDDKIADIAFQCGFGSVSRFYSAFARYASCSPQIFRKRSLSG